MTASPRLSRSRPAAPEPGKARSLRLTQRQQQLLQIWCSQLEQAPQWSGDLPVALLEPCWLRLRRVSVERLAAQLPPDGSEAAPELVRYRQLRQSGLEDWGAQLQCWQEFGSAAFQQAQRRFWQRQEQGNHGWTLGHYLQLLEDYRRSVQAGSPRRLPLLVLAHPGSNERHQLFWLAGNRGPIGHTCA